MYVYRVIALTEGEGIAFVPFFTWRNLRFCQVCWAVPFVGLFVGLFRLLVCYLAKSSILSSMLVCSVCWFVCYLFVCLFVRSSTAQTAGPVVLKFLHLIGNPPETVRVQTPS